MQIYKDQVVLLMKYSDVFEKNVVNIHQEILNRTGYVWYGKVGATPSLKTLNLISKKGEYFCILHSSKTGSYLCSFTEFSDIIPQNGYPEYYEKYFSNKGFFKVFFKLNRMVRLPENFHTNFYLASSGENIMNALNYSMGSMFIAKAYKEYTFE